MGDRRSRRNAEKGQRAIRCGEFSGVEGHLPCACVRGFEGKSQPLLAFTQRSFRPLEFRDVGISGDSASNFPRIV